MSKWSKFYDTLAGGRSDRNIDFDELRTYLERLGWQTNSEGTSHRVYSHPLVPAAINIQPEKDGKAKWYQVKQVRSALDLYTGEDKDGWIRGEPVL